MSVFDANVHRQCRERGSPITHWKIRLLYSFYIHLYIFFWCGQNHRHHHHLKICWWLLPLTLKYIYMCVSFFLLPHCLPLSVWLSPCRAPRSIDLVMHHRLNSRLCRQVIVEWRQLLSPHYLYYSPLVSVFIYIYTCHPYRLFDHSSPFSLSLSFDFLILLWKQWCTHKHTQAWSHTGQYVIEYVCVINYIPWRYWLALMR